MPSSGILRPPPLVVREGTEVEAELRAPIEGLAEVHRTELGTLAMVSVGVELRPIAEAASDGMQTLPHVIAASALGGVRLGLLIAGIATFAVGKSSVLSLRSSAAFS